MLSISENENFVTLTISGLINQSTAFDIMKQFAESKSFETARNRILDLRTAVIDMGVADLRKLVELIHDYDVDKKVNMKVAFVCADETEQSIIQLYSALANEVLSRTSKMFSEFDDAVAWINSSN